MGRSRSRRRRGKSGGQGSGGSGKGKGTGGSRGRSSGTRGGQGKGGSGKGKGTGGSKGRSNNTRGGQSKANRNQNKKARTAVSKAFSGGAAHAAGHTKKPSKLRQQISNLRNNIQRQSTPEAKKQRRADRLRRQFGLDYSSMNPSFKVDVSVDQAARRLGIHQNPLYKRLPRDVRNWKFKYQTQAPTKRGIRDGYRAPNRGGQNITSNTRDQLQSIRHPRSLKGDTNIPKNLYKGWLDFYDRQHKGRSPKEEAAARNAAQQKEFSQRQKEYDVARHKQERRGKPHFRGGPDQIGPGGGLIPLPSIPRPIRGKDQQGPGYGLFPMPIPRPIRDKPERDWLGDFYSRYNISGGEVDQEARDYWTNEAKTKGRTATLDIIRGTARDQGTWGGMSAKDEERIAKIPKGSRTNWRGTVIDRRFAGRPKGRAKPTGRKPTGRGLFPSIAASMAARGF
tara:strand:- start:1015 stop:2367 length:1353 start_codon:yes stop_codon:yes gene_type:complete